MQRVEMRVIEGDPIKVGDTTVALGETKVVEFEGKSANISKTEVKDEAKPVTDDVWDPSNRPNGLMTAGIAPKIPKVSGELEQVQVGEGNTIAERQTAPRGEDTQGGGPKAEKGFKTPGPQPDNSGFAGDRSAQAQSAATTGKVENRGKASTETKTPAKSASRTSTTKKSRR